MNGELATREEREQLDLVRAIDTPSAATATAFSNQGVDVQVATAHKYPRSVSQFFREARDLVVATPDVAASCIYSLKRGNKTIQGPSVRLAELAAYAWGNLRVSATIVGDDGRFIVAQAICFDLQKNLAVGTEVRRRVTDRNGRRYDDDMVGVTSQAALAIARRNAILAIIPRTYIDQLERAARKVAVGEAKDFAAEKRRALDFLRAEGVAEKDVWRVLEIAGEADMTSEHLATLRGFVTAVRDHETTYQEIFAAKPEPGDPGKVIVDVLRGVQSKPTPPDEPGSNG